LKFDGILLFLISILGLIAVQRLLQREIQLILLIITRQPNLAIGIFSILLLPGVFIHEISHLIMAVLLRVPVLRISLIPEVTKKGKIRLGFVQTAKTDVIRDSMIGLAPFIVGLFILVYIGTSKFGIITFLIQSNENNGELFLTLLRELPKVPDFGIWFYFAFAISTTMVPSESDRQSWKVIIIALLILLGVVIVSGFGDWMIMNIYPSINRWLLTLSFILLGSIFVHCLILIPAWIVKQVILKISGLQVISS
jgi:hypothetical protein